MSDRVTLIARTVPETAHIRALDEVAGTPYAERRSSAVGADGLIEFAGRLCYRSWTLPNPETATLKGYMANIIEQKHFSVMEHASVTLLFTGVSRSFLAEITRHRHLSFSVVSQRFVNADSLNYVVPPAIRDMPGEAGERAREILAAHVDASKAAYRELVSLVGENDEHGRKQIREASRSVMPNAAESPMVISGNLRAWREVLEKRLAPGADKEIREIAEEILEILRDVAPEAVQDIRTIEERERDQQAEDDAWRFRETTPFALSFSEDEEDESPEDRLATAVFQALGAASVAWQHTPSGIFDSTRAKEIGDALMEEIRSYTERVSGREVSA